MATTNDQSQRILLAAAAPQELRAILDGLGRPGQATPGPWTEVDAGPGIGLILTGVGPAAACGAVAGALQQNRPRGVLNVGIAGALPARPGESPGAVPGLRDVVIGTIAEFADLGVVTPGGFVSTDDMGFPLFGPESASEPDPGWFDALRPLADVAGPIATVSIASGTDDAAHEIVRRTGALAEAMEGAGVALAAARAGVPFAEVRVISNTTGNRDAQRWDLDGALGRLGSLVARVGPALPAGV